METGTLIELLATWGYPALLLLLLLTGVGSPVPEDFLLLTAGYLAFTEVLSPPVLLVVCVAGVVGSDLALYSAGRRLAWRGSSVWEPTPSIQSRLDRVTHWFDRIGPPLVLIARLVPGTRAIVFIAAGVRAVPANRFILYDTLGALVWVPLLLLAGRSLGARVGDVDEVVRLVQNGTGWLFGTAMSFLALWLIWGREESKL